MKYFKTHFIPEVNWCDVKRRSACLRHMKPVKDGKDFRNLLMEWFDDTGYCLDRTNNSWPDFSASDCDFLVYK